MNVQMRLDQMESVVILQSAQIQLVVSVVAVLLVVMVIHLFDVSLRKHVQPTKIVKLIRSVRTTNVSVRHHFSVKVANV